MPVDATEPGSQSRAPSPYEIAGVRLLRVLRPLWRCEPRCYAVSGVAATTINAEAVSSVSATSL